MPVAFYMGAEKQPERLDDYITTTIQTSVQITSTEAFTIKETTIMRISRCNIAETAIIVNGL
jgi:hypothetical protein